MPKYPKPLSESQQQVADMIAAQAQAMGVPVDLALAMAYQESELIQADEKGRIKTSPKGALGIMQVLPDTARQYKFNLSDLKDPEKNVTAGLTYLKDLLDQSNGVGEIAAAKYNWGPGRKFFKTGEGELPAETVDYIDKITKYGGFGGASPSEQGPPPDKKFVDVPAAPKVGGDNGQEDDMPPAEPGAGVPQAKIHAQESNPEEDAQLDKQLATGAGGALGAMYGFAESRLNAAETRAIRDEAAREGARQRLARLNPQPASPAAPAEPIAQPNARPGALPAAQGSRPLAGAQKWVQSLGNQVPYAIAEKAETMDKVRATGGQNLLNKDAEAMAKIRGMGEGRFQLTGEGRGQLMLPPGVTEQAAQQQAQAAANEERLARIAADTDRARQIRLQQKEANRPINQARAALTSLSKTPAGQVGSRIAEIMYKRIPVLGYGAAGANIGRNISEANEALRNKEYIDAILAASEAAATGASMYPPFAPIAVPAGLGIEAMKQARDYYR